MLPQGLNALVYKTQKQPEFSLVSNGAEVIMIDKRFYEEHCSQRLMTDLREEVGEPGRGGQSGGGGDCVEDFSRVRVKCCYIRAKMG